MKKVYIDASFSQNSNCAIGGFLFDQKIQTLLILETTNTAAEIQTAIWAMTTIEQKNLQIFTDCQGIIQLLNRREKLELSNYWSKSSQKEHHQAQLYRQFFHTVDLYYPCFTKVKGHMPKALADSDQLAFSTVDQQVRFELRKYLAEASLK